MTSESEKLNEAPLLLCVLLPLEAWAQLHRWSTSDWWAWFQRRAGSHMLPQWDGSCIDSWTSYHHPICPSEVPIDMIAREGRGCLYGSQLINSNCTGLILCYDFPYCYYCHVTCSVHVCLYFTFNYHFLFILRTATWLDDIIMWLQTWLLWLCVYASQQAVSETLCIPQVGFP